MTAHRQLSLHLSLGSLKDVLGVDVLLLPFWPVHGAMDFVHGIKRGITHLA